MGTEPKKVGARPKRGTCNCSWPEISIQAGGSSRPRQRAAAALRGPAPGSVLPTVEGQLVQPLWWSSDHLLTPVKLQLYPRLFSKLTRSLCRGSCFPLIVSWEIGQVKRSQYTFVTITPFPSFFLFPSLSLSLPSSSFPLPLLLNWSLFLHNGEQEYRLKT